jgi:TolB-like protein/DNA-binding winged helix-turn-helix (wHTH) protein
METNCGDSDIVASRFLERGVAVSAYHFADFELDPSRFELCRNGHVLKLERIPMELLILLVEKDGSVATRHEIIERLWGKDVFVDTEHGINTAIRKIRQVLRDDSEKPRFVQTVTGKGYRFIGETNGDPPFAAAAPIRPGRAFPIRDLEPSPGQSGGSDSSRGKRTTVDLAEKAKPKLAVVLMLIPLLTAVTLTFAFRHHIFAAHTSQIHSIAVIPFANLSGDPAQDYFADGMTDEVITMLAKSTPLRVVSRTSAMQFKGINRPMRDIARELGVDAILEGSVERSPNHVHMNVQLIHAATDTHLWAESYDRDSAQAILIPAELSQTIAQQVKVAISPARPGRYINPEAHDAYLRGHYFWLSFDTKQSRVFFQKAIDIQPDYAAAWAGMCVSYGFDAIMGFAPPQEAVAQSSIAARKALELDPGLGESHFAMAGDAFLHWDVAQADAEIRRSLELDPNFQEGHYLYYHILNVENRRDQALREAKRATELDPFSRPWGLGSAYINARQWDAAINEFQLQVQARPNDAAIHSYFSHAYWFKGMHKEWEEEMEKSDLLSGKPEEAAALHRSFARGGDKAVERYQADEIEARARKSYVPPVVIAETVSFTGNKDETLKYLEEAYRERSPALVWIQADPYFDFLHTDPQFQAIVKKMGLRPVN